MCECGNNDDTFIRFKIVRVGNFYRSSQQSGRDGEADSCRREGQVEIHRRSRLVQRPPAESVPPIPGARAKLPFKSKVNEHFFSGLR